MYGGFVSAISEWGMTASFWCSLDFDQVFRGLTMKETYLEWREKMVEEHAWGLDSIDGWYLSVELEELEELHEHVAGV
jgi:hypothetical protein